MFAKIRLLEGNIYAQLFIDEWYVQIIPMASKAEIGNDKNTLTRDIGVSNTIIRDNSKEQKDNNAEFSIAMKRFNIESKTSKL